MEAIQTDGGINPAWNCHHEEGHNKKKWPKIWGKIFWERETKPKTLYPINSSKNNQNWYSYKFEFIL